MEEKMEDENSLNNNVKYVKTMFRDLSIAGILFYISGIVIGMIYFKLKSKYCLLLILFIIIIGTVLEGFALSFLNLYKQLLLDINHLHNIEMRYRIVMQTVDKMLNEEDKLELYQKLTDTVLGEDIE